MAKNKGGNTVRVVEELVRPIIEEQGLRLWDVRYEKEGPDWFLRIFIDRDEPLDMNACEAATRAINPVLTAAAGGCTRPHSAARSAPYLHGC